METKAIKSDLVRQYRRKEKYLEIARKENIRKALEIEMKVLQNAIDHIDQLNNIRFYQQKKIQELTKLKEYLEGVCLIHGISDLDIYYNSIGANVIRDIESELSWIRESLQYETTIIPESHR